MAETMEMTTISKTSGYGPEGYCEVFEVETKMGTRYVIAYFGIDDDGVCGSHYYRTASKEKVIREYIYEGRKDWSLAEIAKIDPKDLVLHVFVRSLADSW